MKKYIALILGVLFILGFTASAFAVQAEIPANTQAAVAKGATQITLGGEIRVRGEMSKNLAYFNDNTATLDRKAYYDSRVRLSLEAKVSPNTIGFIQLESGTNSGDTYTWGDHATFGTGATGGVTASNSKRNELYILQAWIQHSGTGLLGMKTGIKAGHQPIALGNGLFYDHSRYGDDAILLFAEPTKDLTLLLVTVKEAESPSTAGNTTQQDDADAYVLAAVWKPNKTTNISFDVTYLNMQNSIAALSSRLGGSQNYGSGNPYNPDLRFWNYGLRGDTEIAGFGIKADVEMQNGKIREISATASNIKLSGLAYMLGVSYKVNPVKLSVEYVYGSGDADGTTDNKQTTFVTSLGGTQHYTYVYEYRTVNAANMANGGIANTKYIKVGANADLTKSLNLDLGVYMLEAVKRVTNNAGYAFTNRASNDKKKIGTEADAKITYQIDKGLQYWVEGGYLWAGDFWKAVTGAVNPDNAYAVRHGIQLNF